MDFSTLFDFLDPHSLDYTWLRLPVDWVFQMACGLLLVSGLLFFAALGLRSLKTRNQARAKKRQQHWTTLLEAIVWPRSLPPVISPLGKTALHRYAEEFLTAWVQATDAVITTSEQDTHQLSELLRQTGLLPVLKSWLEMAHPYRRMLAIRVFGLLTPPDPRVWYQVFHRLQHPESLESINAARTLFHINPAKALPAILELYCKRPDWADSKISAILFFSHRIDKTLLVLDALEAQLTISSRMGECYTRKLLGLLRYHNNAATIEFLSDLLQVYQQQKRPYQLPEEQDPVLMVLDVLNTLENLPDVSFVTPYMDHIDWRYRLKAVRLLGDHSRREEDMVYLSRALQDPEWWVAFRAAEAMQRHQRLDEDKRVLSRSLHLAQEQSL